MNEREVSTHSKERYLIAKTNRRNADIKMLHFNGFIDEEGGGWIEFVSPSKYVNDPSIGVCVIDLYFLELFTQLPLLQASKEE